jgi:hypothetical protein
MVGVDDFPPESPPKIKQGFKVSQRTLYPEI